MSEEKKGTTRFSNRVDDYVKYRPSYPKEIVEFMGEKLGLSKESTVIDIGSGTGIFSEILLRNGNRVYGVEPNAEMRAAAETLLSKYPRFKSIDGTAEKTSLPDHVADFIIAAQAFHWFDQEKTKLEFKRILKPNGYVVLIWNIRKSGTPFQDDYEALIDRFGTDYRQVRESNIVANDQIQAFLGERNYGSTQFPNFQKFDFEGLKGRLFSTSYVPSRSDARYHEMCVELKELFDKYQENKTVIMEYDTLLYFAQI